MDERKKILELLEKGKVNPEEARKLLEALKRSYTHEPHIELDCFLDGMPWFAKHRHFHRHHPRKKVIIKMTGENCC